MGKVAILAKAYRNTGTHGAPTWTEVPQFESAVLNRAWDVADANSRESRAKMGAATQVDIGVTARLKKKPGNANYEAIMDAVEDGTTLDMLFLDGDIATDNNRGVRADWYIGANEDQGIGNVLYEDLTLTPGDENAPTFVKIVGGVPVYSAIS